MRRSITCFLLLLCGALLSGCAATVRSEISAINQLPADLAGKTYVVGKYKEQEGSLEYQRYASLIAAELDAKGLKPAASFAAADLLLFFRYAVDQKTELVPTPIWGQTGYQTGGTVVNAGGRAVYVPTYSVPVYGVTGSADVPTLVNLRSLKLDVLDKTSTAEKPVKLYESTVQSRGGSGQLLQVMPLMIRALFSRWPGPPTRIETIDTPLPRPQ